MLPRPPLLPVSAPHSSAPAGAAEQFAAAGNFFPDAAFLKEVMAASSRTNGNMGINFLNIHNAVTILQARVSAEGRTSLLEQADRFMRETPYMIVDLGESQLSSMLVGELVNMHNFAREHWGERFPGLYLVGLSPQARSVILLSRLDQIMPIEPNLDAAMNAIEKRRREEKPAAAG